MSTARATSDNKTERMLNYLLNGWLQKVSMMQSSLRKPTWLVFYSVNNACDIAAE